MKLKLFLTLINLCFIFHSVYAQEEIQKLKDKILTLHLPRVWDVQIDSNRIKFELTDTMELCGRYDLSPLNDFDTINKISKYKLELSLESGWTKKHLKRSQRKNEDLRKYLENRIIKYGDSLDWKIFKTNKELVMENPTRYFYIVRNWSPTEKEMIDQYNRGLPRNIINEVGVFVRVNTSCVMPERKNKLIRELDSKLGLLGISIAGN